MKCIVFAAALVVFPVVAAAQDSGRELSQLTFQSVDQNDDGTLSRSEVETMSSNILFSMDYDGSESVDLEEFMAWDFGYYYLAEERGETDRYESVKRVMFALLDFDGDGVIDASENHAGNLWAFQRADLDNDGVLSEDEYLQGWLPIVILRAGATAGDPA